MASRMRTLIAFLDRDLTRFEHRAKSKWARLGWRQLRITLWVGRRVVLGKHSERAAALTYFSLLTLIPALAVVFSLWKAIGGFAEVQTQARDFLLDYIPDSSTQVAEWLDSFINSFNAAALGLIAMATLLVTVILTLSSIEDAFNQTWSVRRPRAWGTRLIVYWSLLTIGPVLLGASLALTAAARVEASSMHWLNDHAPIFSFLKTLLPVVSTSIAFTALYIFMPSTRVRIGAAWAGGVSAAILFEIGKWGYAAYTAKSVSSNKLYGSLAAFPVFIVWLNYSWRFVLFGADIVHATQYASADPVEETDPRTNQATREEAAVRMCAIVAEAFAKNRPPPTVTDLTRKLLLPAHLVDVLCGHMVAAGLLREVNERAQISLVPAQPLETLTVADIVLALRHMVGVSHWATATDQGDAIDHLLLGCENEAADKMRAVRWLDLIGEPAKMTTQEAAPVVAQGTS